MYLLTYGFHVSYKFEHFSSPNAKQGSFHLSYVVIKAGKENVSEAFLSISLLCVVIDPSKVSELILCLGEGEQTKKTPQTLTPTSDLR